MSEVREHRQLRRTDRQILAHPSDIFLLELVDPGEVVSSAEHRMDLRRLAHDDLVLAPFGRGARPILLPRGQRLLAAARGEITLRADD